MSRWQRRVDDLLYDGESVRESLDVGTARIVVTSHRVLAFTPEMDAENFQQADRPNVTGVDTGALAEGNLLERGLRFGVVGIVLVVTGLLFDVESMLGDSLDFESTHTDEFGLGGLMEVTEVMMNLLVNLDDLLVTFGALALFLSAVLLGVYWFLRTPTLVVELAGEEEDIHVPRPDDADGVRIRLERAIFPDPDDAREDVLS